jgi:hypothetical protein
MAPRSALLFVLWTVIPVTAVATSPVAPREHDIPRLLELQEAITAGVDHAEDALTSAQKHTIRAEQKRIRAIVEGKPSLDALTLEQRLQLVNAQERINAALAGTRDAEESRLVCRRGRPTGSQLARLRCTRVAEDNLQREMADRDADGDLLAK